MRFDPNNGGKPTQSTVKTGTLPTPPQQNPQRDGFQFDGWTYGGQPFDYQTPILHDTTLKAQWTKTTDWTLNPDHGPATGARLIISPPNGQEPYYVRIQAAGDRFIGLTGDGRIYTWTQNGTPNRVPSLAQASDGFHYLQAAAGSQWQAALGSDQHIYTWTSQQATPTMLDTRQNAQFTSISMNNDRLLAVDQKSRIHTFQASQSDTQNPTPKLGEQATASLPGQAQAVTAVSSASQILIVDADGQAWTWDANNIVKAKPARVRQNPGMRIIQAQALNQGFLLLDANGQAYYLADSNTGPTALSLPDGAKTSRVIANNDQALITDTEGRVWTWKPGETPMRADNGNKQYIQAVSVGSRITTIDRQGGIVAWSLDAQGNPGRPARLDTAQTPTLKSASLDGQTLTLSKTAGAWQTQTPASKPGQAAITITGKQNGQRFTRNLKYMVNQTQARDMEPSAPHTVTFNTDGGTSTPENQKVSYPYGRVQRPSPDPTRNGYQFDGWFTGNIAYDFSKPVTKDLNLTAHWTSKNPSTAWTISPNKGSQLGNEMTTITPPASSRGIKLNQVSSSRDNGSSLSVGSDGNSYSWGDNYYGQLGDGTTGNTRTAPVVVKKPDLKTYPDRPADFTYVQVSAGGPHSLALGSDGYVYAWGLNDHGQLGNGTKSDSSTPVRVHGPDNSGEGLKAIQVSAGARNSIALGTDGSVYTWGSMTNNNNSFSSPQIVPTKVKDPSDASGVFHALQISTSWSFDLSIGQDGYVYAWGYNNLGQLGNGTTSGYSTIPNRVPASTQSKSAADPWLKATQVSAGGWYALAIDEDGNTWAWGQNNSGQLGNGTSTSYNVANPVPQKVQYPTNGGTVKAVQISAGRWHSLAIDKEGNAWAWGFNTWGELGINTTMDQLSPVKVFASAQSTNSAGPWLDVSLVSAGDVHSLAIDTSGNALAWGWNDSGELGSSNSGTSLTPVPVSFNLQPVIMKARFDTNPGTNLKRGDGSSITVLTPAHLPGLVKVSVDYTMGGAGRTMTDKSLTYTYLPAGVLPKAGGEGILLALATGMTGMGGVMASRRHRREQHQLLHASHE